jgi:ParB family chromosome partitioning protein
MAKKNLNLSKLKAAGKHAHLQTNRNEIEKVSHAKLLEIPLDKIESNPLQPRFNIDSEELSELAESIKENGLLQPVLVDKNNNGKYILLAGHRRVAAFKKLGKSAIPAVEYNQDNKEDSEKLLTLALLENIQRVNLSPIEVAMSFKQALDSKIFDSAESFSKKIGKSKSYISKMLSLLKLNENIINDLINNRPVKDFEALYLLQKIKDEKLQYELYEKLKKGLIKREDIKNRIKNLKVSHAKLYEMKISKTSLKFNVNLKNIDDDKKKSIEEEIKVLIKKYLDDSNSSNN